MVADLAFVGALAWISTGIGSRLLRYARAKPVRPDDALAQAIPLGLGAIALALLLLGEVGRLDRFALLLVFGAVGFLTRKVGSGLIARATGLQLARIIQILVSGGTLDRVMLGLTGLTLLGAGLTASLPVTDGDALCYHLQVPKLFLSHKSVYFAQDQHETVYPLLVELINTIALEFRGPVACRWIQFLLGLVFAANVTLLARPILQSRAWWAGSIALLVPAISNGMSAPLNDVALAAFGTASIAAVMRSIDQPTLRASALAGTFMGLALGVKYPALILFALLFAWLCMESIVPLLRGDAASVRKFAARAFVFVAATITVGGCWYLRAFVHTGNPVFPYFRHVFGGAGLDEVLDPTRRAMPVSIWNVLTALVPMTLSPDRFESFAHQFGPVFLLFLPAIVFERPPRRMLALLAIGYGFLMICVTQRQSTRFVLTALGPMSVGVAYVTHSLSQRRTRSARLLLLILTVVLSLESVQAVARCRSGYKVILGRETPEQFLTRREPTYQVGKWINAHLPESARLIGQDHRGFYIPRPYSMELAHRRRTGLGRHGESPQTIIEHFRNAGFTHLMLCPPIPETAVEFDPALGRLLSPWIARNHPIYDTEIADADGVVRRYMIYRLEAPEAMVAAGPDTAPEVTR